MRESDPPKGFEYVPVEHWESVTVVRRAHPLNGHRGVFAYHNDDCCCVVGGWPCNRDGRVWSCCGQTERYARCTREG